MLVAFLSLACAAGAAGAGAHPTVWARSHNTSEVEVYTLCGSEEASWVGLVPAEGAAAFELAGEGGFCPWGRNFFLVVRNQGRGYWAGPVQSETSTTIELVIEKYAGLSTVRSLEE